MTGYADLADLEEDSRIQIIGDACVTGKVIGVCLEKSEPEKIARYVRKMAERFPGMVELDRVDGPVPGVVTIRFQRRAS